MRNRVEVPLERRPHAAVLSLVGKQRTPNDRWQRDVGTHPVSKSRKPLLNEPGVHPTAASRTAVTLRTCSSTDHPYQRNPCEESEAGHGDSIEEAPAGSGIWAVQLAKRGWQVTGVDLVEKALQRASDRGESAGVDVTLVHGDVTATACIRRRIWLPVGAGRRDFSTA